MSWIRGTSTSYINLSNDIVEAATEESLDTVDSVAAGGSSYVVGDILTLSGGTFTIAAQVEVTAESSGAVTATRRYNDGVYTVTPGDPVSTTGGTGTGCTLNVSWIENGWTAELDAVYSGSDREVVLNGEGGGTDEIFVGWRTFGDVPGDYYNWELHGMTGYDSGLDFDEQPLISPGFFDAGLAANKSGCYLTLANASIQYWLQITTYRIILTCKVGSAYFHSYMGWGNRFATSTEYPYPMLIAGNTSLPTAKASQSILTSTLTDPWISTTSGGNVTGPVQVLMTDNVWYGVWNSTISSGARTWVGNRTVLPCGRPKGPTDTVGIPEEDRYTSITNGRFNLIIPDNGLSSTPSANLQPTDSSPDDYRAMFPTLIVFSEPAPQIVMEIDNVWWVHTFGGVTSEDRIVADSEVYRVFQNCNRTDSYAYLAIRES